MGPISFVVKVEASPPVTKPTPVPPPAASAEGQDDESVAAMLLSLQDDGSAAAAGPVGSDGIPQGSTVYDLPTPPADGSAPPPAEEAKPGEKKPPSKAPTGNTSSAAKAILEKYTRRQRS